MKWASPCFLLFPIPYESSYYNTYCRQVSGATRIHVCMWYVWHVHTTYVRFYLFFIQLLLFQLRRVQYIKTVYYVHVRSSLRRAPNPIRAGYYVFIVRYVDCWLGTFLHSKKYYVVVVAPSRHPPIPVIRRFTVEGLNLMQTNLTN